ncbi:hypothetical protein TgHK011_002208 [Trichoderma gracile]|nr:hypothetical protein TgHK011_002208 [Trichoderma gracile]
MADDNDMLFCPEGQTLPPEMLDPNWNVLDHLSPFHQACYMHHQRHRLNHLKALKVYHTDGQHILLLDEAGLLSAVDVPLPTRDQLQKPPPELIYGKVAEQKKNDKELSSLAIQILNVLQKGSKYTYGAWKTLRQLLETDLAHHKTPDGLIEAVKEASEEEQIIWSALSLFRPGFTAMDVVIIPFSLVLNGICLVVGYTPHEESNQFELLMEIDKELCENVLEFRDMHQRMSAYLIENGTNETEITNMKLRRLREAWERVSAPLSKGYMALKMDEVLHLWRGSLAETTGGAGVSSPLSQTASSLSFELLSRVERHTSPLIEDCNPTDTSTECSSCSTDPEL